MLLLTFSLEENDTTVIIMEKIMKIKTQENYKIERKEKIP